MRWADKLDDSLVPLKKYLETYDSNKEILEINIESYIKKWREVKHSLEEFKTEIKFHMKKQEEIEMTIPHSVSTGMFLVNCDEVRNNLGNKRKNLAFASNYFH